MNLLCSCDTKPGKQHDDPVSFDKGEFARCKKYCQINLKVTLPKKNISAKD